MEELVHCEEKELPSIGEQKNLPPSELVASKQLKMSFIKILESSELGSFWLSRYKYPPRVPVVRCDIVSSRMKKTKGNKIISMATEPIETLLKTIFSSKSQSCLAVTGPNHQ